MTLEDIAAKVKKVRMTGPGKATALCPAHPDKRPSLSLRDVDGRILVYCFAGCTTEAVCSALNIDVSDLFVETKSDMKKSGKTLKQNSKAAVFLNYHTSRMLKNYAHQILNLADGFYWHAEAVLSAAKRKDISNWSETDLENAWEVVARAHQKMKLVHALEDLAFDLRRAALTLEGKNDAPPRARVA